MKKILVLCALVVFLLSISSAFAERYGTVITRNLSRAITVGNSTCIPLWVDRIDTGLWIPADDSGVKSILEIKDAFSKAHPELRITGSHETYHFNKHGDGFFKYIWIDHEPRK